MIELFETAKGKSYSLDGCTEVILAEARKPQHYIKQTLIPKTAPELFNSCTDDNKACIQIKLDDGRTMIADMVMVNRQSIKIFAADHNSSPSLIDLPLRRKVW